jgi:hypothetical protein
MPKTILTWTLNGNGVLCLENHELITMSTILAYKAFRGYCSCVGELIKHTLP